MVEKDKTSLRQRLRQFLKELSPEQVREGSRQVVRHLFTCPEYQRAKTVMAFLSLPGEVDTADILADCWQGGKRVVVPRIDSDQKTMVAVEIRDLAGLAVNWYGIREPVGGPPIPPTEIDLVLVPGLGFDLEGNRLGRGGGYFDRFLSRLQTRAVKCGLGWEKQIVECVPVRPWDVKVDMLVTETGVRRLGMIEASS